MFKLYVLTRWEINFCIRSSPLREVVTKIETAEIQKVCLHSLTICVGVEPMFCSFRVQYFGLLD